MEQCRLCKCTDKPLKESHIIPKMFYNALKRNSPTRIMRMADDPNRGVQDGLKLPFLCGECEELFGIVNKCAVEKYPKSQAAIPPVPPVRIFAGGSPCGLKLFTRMVL